MAHYARVVGLDELWELYSTGMVLPKAFERSSDSTYGDTDPVLFLFPVFGGKLPYFGNRDAVVLLNITDDLDAGVMTFRYYNRLADDLVTDEYTYEIREAYLKRPYGVDDVDMLYLSSFQQTLLEYTAHVVPEFPGADLPYVRLDIVFDPSKSRAHYTDVIDSFEEMAKRYGCVVEDVRDFYLFLGGLAHTTSVSDRNVFRPLHEWVYEDPASLKSLKRSTPRGVAEYKHPDELPFVSFSDYF